MQFEKFLEASNRFQGASEFGTLESSERSESEGVARGASGGEVIELGAQS